MLKFWKDFKLLILIFLIFFGSVYIAMRFDQAMGWEKQRTEKNQNWMSL
jgi:hypothetical protein